MRSTGVTQAPEPTGRHAKVDRLIESAATPQTSGSVGFPRLEALLAAAAAPDSGPQPGERELLDHYRELVAGTPSLAARRRRQLAVVAIASTVVALSGGVAAAAAGSLPGAAQSTAQSVLGALGVHVPGPNSNAGDHPDQRGQSGDDHGRPASTPPSDAPEPALPSHPAHPTTPVGNPPTPGNSGTSRHHGNPTPTATTHPTPHHGKPTTAPTTAHPHATPVHPSSPRVTHPIHPSITR